MSSLRYEILLTISLVKKINLLRFFNLCQLYFSYRISKILKSPVIWGLPWSVTVEPTNICNLTCPECPTGSNMLSRAKGSISSELFQTIVRQTGKRAIFLNLYFQGEPFINTELINLFQIASGKRLFISCATNAHYINENNVEGIVSSGVDQLIISFDGTTQESYQKYRRGGDFNKVLKAIKVLVDEKKRQSKKFPLLVLQFLILKHNEENISEAKEMFKELKADKLVFKTAQLYNLTVSNEFLPENSKNSRYKIKPDGTISINGYSKNKCWKSWSTCVITWDGNVVPCCFDKNADHCYGNILNNNFRTIMLNKTTRDFKKEILQNRKNIDICSNCSQT